jgi:hypothetical protein
VLDFVLDVPEDARGCKIKLTARASKARADPDEGWPAELDGNQDPSPQSGAAPNGTDYEWTVNVGPRHPPGKPSKHLPSCQGSTPQLLCFTFDGTGSTEYSVSSPLSDGEVMGETSRGTETWHMVWKEPLQRLRVSGGPYPPQAGSTDTGHAVINYTGPAQPPDCDTDMAFDRAKTAETLYNSFSYTSPGNPHELLMVATAPMFEQGATGNCPSYPGEPPADAETNVLHPPVGFNIGAYEQFRFMFSDRPGTYSENYRAGQHEFTGGGYHGSWTGTMTVEVGK